MRPLILCLLLLVTPLAHPADPARGRFALQDVYSPVIARDGMVVTEEALATRVGAGVLKRGGNAVDAAVAVAFALAVVLPEAGNLGGGGFMLVHEAKTGKDVAIDYREVAPLGASRDMYLKSDGSVDHEELDHGAKGVGVPGTVAGLDHALRRYGTLPWRELVTPALELAEKGFVLNAAQAASLELARERLLRNPEAARTYFKPDGSAYAMGERMRYPDLAATLRALRREGPGALYGGAVGERLVAAVQRHGGVITHEDLVQYRVQEREPVRGSYRGYTVVSMPPPSSGGVHLVQMLNILEGYGPAAAGIGAATDVHRMIEAMRRAYADRSKYLGDPDFVQVPVAALTSKDYAARLRAQIDPARATPSAAVQPGVLAPHESPQTTHFSIVDRWGNAVANTYTLNWSFGSGIVAEGTGILLNNEMDDFSAKPGEPNIYGLIGGEANAVAPRKRPLSSMTPTFLLKDGDVFMVTGSPGGSQIITTVLQTIVDVVDHGANAQLAVNAPRFHHQWWPDEVLVESTFSPDTAALLAARGHHVVASPPIGTAQVIVRSDGWLQGAADPRRGGGAAMGP